MSFNWREVHHIYWGLILIALSFLWGGAWLWVPGAILVIDDGAQHFLGVDPSPIHIAYAYTLWQIPFVQKFNRWLDRLFGKE